MQEPVSIETVTRQMLCRKAPAAAHELHVTFTQLITNSRACFHAKAKGKGLALFKILSKLSGTAVKFVCAAVLAVHVANYKLPSNIRHLRLSPF